MATTTMKASAAINAPITIMPPTHPTTHAACWIVGVHVCSVIVVDSSERPIMYETSGLSVLPLEQWSADDRPFPVVSLSVSQSHTTREKKEGNKRILLPCQSLIKYGPS